MKFQISAFKRKLRTQKSIYPCPSNILDTLIKIHINNSLLEYQFGSLEQSWDIGETETCYVRHIVTIFILTNIEYSNCVWEIMTALGL